MRKSYFKFSSLKRCQSLHPECSSKLYESILLSYWKRCYWKTSTEEKVNMLLEDPPVKFN